MRIWAFPSFYPYDYPDLHWHGIFAHRQIKAMVENGADIQVVQPVYWHPGGLLAGLHPDWKRAHELNYPAKRVHDGVTVYHPRIENLKPSRIFRKSYHDRYVSSIIGFFKNNGIKLDPKNDIFYSQWAPDAGMVQEAAQKLGVRSAVMVVGDDVLILPQRSKHNHDFFVRTWQQADIRLAVAAYLGKEANKLVGTELPFYTIHRGVNYDFFKPAAQGEQELLKREFGLPEDKLLILTIGAPNERKGWHDLFDALKTVKDSYSNFVLAGVDGGLKILDLKEEARKRGLENHFISLGEVVPQKINRLYNAVDIFCLPSHSEGIANSVVEAM
jgi:glycosyltransferase involved in cell wall biosynthesis